MDGGLSLTLLVLFCAQCILSLVMMGPRLISRPIIKLLRGSASSTATATTAIVSTLSVGLLVIAGSNVFELYSRYTQRGGADVQRTMMEALDTHRVWLSAVLSVANALLMAINRALAVEAFERDRLQVNLDALKRQVEGLRTEYNRVTSKDSSAGQPGGDEASRLKKQVASLLDDKRRLQDQVDAAVHEKEASQKREDAMKTQSQNLAKEWDRLVDEKLALERKLAQLTGGGGGAKKAY